MELGHFACEASGAIAENFAGIGDAIGDAVRCFVENDGAVFDAKTFKGAAAFPVARREKADKKKFFGGQTGSGEGSEQRGGAWDGNDGNVVA